MARERARRGMSSGGIGAWLTRHGQALFFTLGRLWRTPLSTLMTVAVIGIALALPAGLQVLVKNTRSLSGGWEASTRVSVFLQQGISGARLGTLAEELRRRADIARLDTIDPEQALAEFKSGSGLGDVVGALESNPLPAVLVIQPASADSAQVAALAEALRALPEVDRVQMDTQWLKRLNAILDIIRRGIAVVAVLFGLAVIVVTSNTIRLDIQNHRPEIEVQKLVGATNAFIRRPFLYTGLWYGIGGGLTALLLTGLSLLVLQGPVRDLAGLYGSDFSLSGLSADGMLLTLGAGALLGWLGSWVAVARHLGQIEPS